MFSECNMLKLDWLVIESSLIMKCLSVLTFPYPLTNWPLRNLHCWLSSSTKLVSFLNKHLVNFGLLNFSHGLFPYLLALKVYSTTPQFISKKPSLLTLLPINVYLALICITLMFNWFLPSVEEICLLPGCFLYHQRTGSVVSPFFFFFYGA